MIQVEVWLQEQEKRINELPDPSDRTRARDDIVYALLQPEGPSEVSRLVGNVRRAVFDQDPLFLQHAHALAEHAAGQMEKNGYADIAAMREGNNAYFGAITAFAVRLGKTIPPAFLNAHQSNLSTYLDIAEKMATVPDNAYDDAGAVSAAVKQALPVPKNPLRKAAASMLRP